MTSVVSYWLGMASSLVHWLRTEPIVLDTSLSKTKLVFNSLK